jgi:hypothetical protein
MGPDGAAWAFAMAKARPVKHDDPVFFGRLGDKSAGCKILNDPRIAVQQDKRFALALLDVVQSETAYLYEFSTRWIFPFRSCAMARFIRAKAARAATTNTALDTARCRANTGTDDWAKPCDDLKLSMSKDPSDPNSKEPDAFVALQQRQPCLSRFVPRSLLAVPSDFR